MSLNNQSPKGGHPLDDISADSASISFRPSFEMLNSQLYARGYISAPLVVAGMTEEHVEHLADALHAMLQQREVSIDSY